MPEVRSRLEHAGAASIDHGHVVLMAVLGRRLGNAAGAGAAMHPHVLDTELDALAQPAPAAEPPTRAERPAVRDIRQRSPGELLRKWVTSDNPSTLKYPQL